MFRKPKRREEKVVRSALRAFGSENLLKENELLIKDSGGKKELYALSKDLANFIGMVKLNYVCVGIKVGEVGSRRLRFTLEGSFYLIRREKKRVYVDEKGEMLFLYGRDIFARSVVKVTDDVEENDVVFVCNDRGDILGLGKSRFDACRYKDVENDRVVVENLVDRGEYLRKEKLYEAF
ncbi:PUA domain-containing protein [Archaeoglobus sp.]